MRRRFLPGMLLALILCIIFPVGAEDSYGQAPEEYLSFLDSIPEEVRNRLPDGIFSLDTETLGETVGEMCDFSTLLRTLGELIGLRLTDALSILATVCGLLLLSSLCRAFRASFRSETLGRAFAFCSTLTITIALLGESYRSLASVVSYFDTLGSMTVAVIPLMGALYVMGGNAAAAVASSAGLSTYVTLLEGFVGKSILPFCGICMAFALIRALDPGLRTGTLSATLKKNYTTILTFLMMLLSAMLAAQTTLGARGDSLAMRSAKFAAGSWIPVVGGSVGELLRTLGAGVGYLRGAVGICGVLLLLLTILPVLVELFLLRAAWQLSASLADLLGCDEEKRLLDEFASILGYLIAAVSICSSVLLISLTLLAHCAAALG